MPISKDTKHEIVDRLVAFLNDSDGFAIIQIQALPVKTVDSLRRKIRDAGGRVVVTKNKLMGKALEQVGWQVPTSQLKGPTALVFGNRNFPGVAKALLDHLAAENLDPEKLRAIGGVMTGTDILDASRLEAVSKLPSLEELRAQLIGLIVSPATGIVTVLNGGVSGVVNVIQAYLDDKKPSDAA